MAVKSYSNTSGAHDRILVVAPKFILSSGGSEDPTQDWWLK